MEKGLKALVCRATRSVPPLIHNLEKLAELSQETFEEDTLRLFAEANDYCLQGRYSFPSNPLMTLTELEEKLKQVREAIEWLLKM